ncbi:MAG: dipeptide epimerase [Acidobacteria bacterium]|nr:dipeptide epimerase [Acidobacteriota bacterium]
MKIREVETIRESVPLSRPYTIAGREMTTAVDLFQLRIVTDSGLVGLGSGSPAEDITGESPDACAAALAPDNLDLVGRDARHLGGLCAGLDGMRKTPAARAAVDMALHDLFARRLGIPLADFLGRCHDALPTSITIGIKPAAETLAEADEYIRRGFTHLKVKLGHDFEDDQDRLRQLRQTVGRSIRIRVDANQGYSLAQTQRFGATLRDLDIEFMEQPLPRAAVAEMRTLPDDLRTLVAADESLQSPADAMTLAAKPAACGIFNIKLMKCGGITPALEIAVMAAAAGLDLMWGCMDESVISISAALHTAFACPATRYLDLDGSLDLAEDVARGGFILKDGRLHIPDAPGLGVELVAP